MRRKTIDILRELVRPFSLHVVLLVRDLRDCHQSILASQFLRSGTSIGANLAEGSYAQTHGDAITKYSIAQKEAAESQYWIELFMDMRLIRPDKPYGKIYRECIKIQELLATLLKSERRAHMREKEQRQGKRSAETDEECLSD